jgi:hypothetical protein
LYAGREITGPQKDHRNNDRRQSREKSHEEQPSVMTQAEMGFVFASGVWCVGLDQHARVARILPS